MTSPEWCAWVKFGGGQALWDEVSGEFGLKAVTCGSTGTQAGGWFNKEINSADDLKGLKMNSWSWRASNIQARRYNRYFARTRFTKT